MTEELVIECIEHSLKDTEEINESVFVKCNNCEFVSATLDDLKTHGDSNHVTRKSDKITSRTDKGPNSENNVYLKSNCQVK